MIYSRFGAAVEITAAEQRTIYRERRRDEILIHEDGPPAKPKGKVEPIYGCWYVKAKLAGHYSDGGGVIGEPLREGKWLSENEFRADDGIREIHAVCARVELQTAPDLMLARKFLGGVNAAMK